MIEEVTLKNLERPEIENKVLINPEKTKEYISFENVKEQLSPKETEIYENAGLSLENVNGRDVLIRNDIDLDAVDVKGRTNLERMEKGFPPIVDNQQIELHHVDQKNDGPMAELMSDEHRGKENNSILHDSTRESEIDRPAFKGEREQHWKDRAEFEKQKMDLE